MLPIKLHIPMIIDKETFEKSLTEIKKIENKKKAVGTYWKVTKDGKGNMILPSTAVFWLFFWADTNGGETGKQVFKTIFGVDYGEFYRELDKIKPGFKTNGNKNNSVRSSLKGTKSTSDDTLKEIIKGLFPLDESARKFDIEESDIEKIKLEAKKSEEHKRENEKEAAKIELGLDGLEETEKDQFIKARLGQSGFRNSVLNLYNRKCVVTNVEERTDGAGILIASHIRAWSDCVGANEKLDEHNALLLAPHIDKLFDKYLISFKDDGSIIASDEIKDILKKWGVTIEKIETKFSPKTKGYLKFHRTKYDEINKKSLIDTVP